SSKAIRSQSQCCILLLPIWFRPAPSTDFLRGGLRPNGPPCHPPSWPDLPPDPGAGLRIPPHGPTYPASLRPTHSPRPLSLPVALLLPPSWRRGRSPEARAAPLLALWLELLPSEPAVRQIDLMEARRSASLPAARCSVLAGLPA